MRIVYCINTIKTFGGIETVTITKANGLARNPDNKVWIITCCDDSLKTAIPVSDRVDIIGLNYRLSWGFPWNIIQLFSKIRGIKKEIFSLFERIHPDIVVSTGGLDKWIVPSYRGKWSLIREMHMTKYYREIDLSLNNGIKTSIAEFLDYSLNNKKFDRIVVLTEEERLRNWNENRKVCVIPNPVRFAQSAPAALDNKLVIAVGRLTYQKNFKSLIRAFSIVASSFPDWRLDIYGEGKERASLSAEISSLGLSKCINLKGNSQNIYAEMQDASIMVSSSLYEGLPMVMLEAMSCGLPIVSYACPCGPKDIIRDGTDGFLVPVGEEAALAEKMCRLIENESLRKRMGASAVERSKDYSIDRICKMWEVLFRQLRKNS